MAGNYLPFFGFWSKIQAMNENEFARVSLSDITPLRLERLFEIYDETVGGAATYRLAHNFPISYYMSQLEELRTSRILEWRFGSRISMDSKLFLQRTGLNEDSVVAVYFSPNVDGPETSAAESLRKAFNVAVIGFLREEGLMAE